MNDLFYMKKAVRLAKQGRGKVNPNPLVGAVIVKNDKIIGQGYHKVFGGAHAEISAIKSAGADVKGADLYCTLEPCSHWGKTPPCIDSIILQGIKKVIIGVVDPNPAVNGKGIRLLRESGIEVTEGILEDKCWELNETYIKYVTTGKPFVTVKMAQSLDGKISGKVNERTGITSGIANRYVHKLRTEYDAVMIGRRTLDIDNPLLTPRLVNGRIPARIVLDTNLESDPKKKLFNTIDAGRVIILTASDNVDKAKLLRSKGVEIIKVNSTKNGFLDLKEVLHKLGENKISSVLVEGGAALFSSLLKERLVDRVILLIAPRFFGGGVDLIDKNIINNTSGFVLKNATKRKLGQDLMITGEPSIIQADECSQE